MNLESCYRYDLIDAKPDIANPGSVLIRIGGNIEREAENYFIQKMTDADSEGRVGLRVFHTETMQPEDVRVDLEPVQLELMQHGYPGLAFGQYTGLKIGHQRNPHTTKFFADSREMSIDPLKENIWIVSVDSVAISKWWQSRAS